MSNLRLENSPINRLNYRLNHRLAFLYCALRTRSLFAREELAKLAENSKRAKLDLAWLIHNQGLSETDFSESFKLYRAVIEQHSWRALSHMHRVDLAILATKLGDIQFAHLASDKLKNVYALVRDLLPNHLPTVPMQGIQEGMHATIFAGKDYSVASRFLQLDIANPLRGLSHGEAQSATETAETQDWLAKLNRELFSKSIEPLTFANPTAAWQSPFDLLTAASGQAKIAGPKVTVVMSAYRPDESIFTAVRSAIEQTYSNLEILLIDDCSPSEFDKFFDQVASMDDRIRVLRQTENGGTYRIRNRALDEATGEYITFQDSDDYMHPRRVELHVADLEKHRRKMANVSLSTRLTNRLEGIESNRRLRIGICEPALMFRRVQVRDRIGYFDSVRKSADSEYRKRIMKAFKQDCSAVHPFRILTVQRADNGGLTQGELGFRWITEFRLIYRDCYLNFHRTGAATNWHLSRDEKRNFYAPRQNLMPSAQARSARKFDVVFAVNLRDHNQISQLEQRVSAALSQQQSVGLLQVNSLYPITKKLGTISRSAIGMLNAGQAEMVFPSDEISCQEFVLLAPNAFALGYSGAQFNFKVGRLKVDAAPESFVSQPLEPLLERALKNSKLV